VFYITGRVCVYDHNVEKFVSCPALRFLLFMISQQFSMYMENHFSSLFKQHMLQVPVGLLLLYSPLLLYNLSMAIIEQTVCMLFIINQILNLSWVAQHSQYITDLM